MPTVFSTVPEYDRQLEEVENHIVEVAKKHQEDFNVIMGLITKLSHDIEKLVVVLEATYKTPQPIYLKGEQSKPIYNG